MEALLAGALTVGIFAGLWAYSSSLINIPTWAGFLAWAVFYAAGGKLDGLKKGLPSVLAGVFWAWAAVTVWSMIAAGNTAVLCMIVAVISFILVYESKIQILFSFVPGAFVGASAFFAAFGNGPNALQVAAGLICGLTIGYIQQSIATAITKKDQRVEIPREHRQEPILETKEKETERESLTVA